MSDELQRNQPCGCIVCVCEDTDQCHGCGAKHCGTHPLGEIPNPAYTPMTPHALTREQVNDLLQELRDCPAGVWVFKRDAIAEKLLSQHQSLSQQAQELAYWKQQAVHFTKRCAEQGDSIAEDRRLLDQQAQEVERLEGVCLDRLRSGQRLADENILLRQSLASMTAERDEACGELLVSLDDAPIGSLAGKLVTANRVLRSHLATLQATLAARERDIAKLKAELNETFVDEKETVWTRPTAWAYAMVCKARDKHEQEAGRLRNNVELMARDMCSMPSDLYQEWLDSDSQVHFRQWLAQRALKGDE